MNIFDALKATHQSYVSDLSSLISDDQVSLHSLEGARDDNLRALQAEHDALVEWLGKTYEQRAALLRMAFDRQITEVKARLARVSHIRDRVDEGRVVQRPLEELTDDEAAIIPKLAIRGGSDAPRDLDAA